MKWSEQSIGRALAQQFFNRKYLVVVPNCNWTGYECDILAVTENLRIIDVEIKISRSDLKADAKKDKWVKRTFTGYAPEEQIHNEQGRLIQIRRRALYDELRLQWPRKIWKHYYALPEDIWEDNLLDSLGSPASGVLLLTQIDDRLYVRCRRPAKPCKDADKLSPATAIDIARLASLRMWNAYQKLDEVSCALVQKTFDSPEVMMGSNSSTEAF
ncbi:hypothetical protein [Eoetvoesiella caeni]|uniref:Uncharacterized protein n=1 Tax=Eoetvoesiella caeni TaxID=645616 RepID=A0A366HAI2_9BURK|nr:hypothetical protein [Eoetvoesiella caeni]MCI2809369.1 hypothetical protein [Eoetvoesiella caeni]RBP39301.1 hypothetical protein DFR37_10593 [Eoetvoesiella caeni]